MKKEYLGMEIEVDEDLIAHIGVKYRSGRCPWGSGKDPHQHDGAFSFRKEYKRLKDSGLTESQIAQNMGFKSTTELRKQVSIAKEITLNAERETVLAMHARGSTVKEISAATGIKSVTKINNIINTLHTCDRCISAFFNIIVRGWGNHNADSTKERDKDWDLDKKGSN
jgi:hypothetical protein